MQFSHTNHASGTKASRFALIAGLHVALGVLFVHSLNTRHLSLSKLPDAVLLVLHPDPPAPPPPPPEPPMPMPRLAPPPPFVPAPEIIPTTPPPEPSPMATSPAPDPQPAQPAPSVPQSAPQPSAPPAGKTVPGQMRTAVFADAKGCALPAYPANAARNGDTGTTQLALLVGADGRVSSARIEHSSGSRDLDRAAIQALSLCKFKPATNNGVPEAAWAQLAYVWTLD